MVKDYKAQPSPHEQTIIDTATSFAAYLFVSRSRVFNYRYPDQLGAERAAQRLADAWNKPAIVYAMRGEAQAYLKSVVPRSRK